MLARPGRQRKAQAGAAFGAGYICGDLTFCVNSCHHIDALVAYHLSSIFFDYSIAYLPSTFTIDFTIRYFPWSN